MPPKTPPSPPRPRAILVGVQLQRADVAEYEASLAELNRLVDTLGFDVAETISQRVSSLSAATLIGPGKSKELATRIQEASDNDKISAVIFDHPLTPTQLRNLMTATGVEILDRPAVILEIFSRHARTREAKLQVEIARLKYLAPRERFLGPKVRNTDRMGGRGLAESAHELERRQVRDRLAELRAELEKIHEEQENRRRNREGQPKVAIVGYTNAGKSSIMRALTASPVLVANQLFATLETTVRAMQPETNPRVLLSDTVGFIRNLPHDLVASFRSTLDEALDASLLLYVVDAADPDFRAQLKVSQEVLHSIGAEEITALLALNKTDTLDAKACSALSTEFPEAIQVSALDPKSMATLRARILEHFLSQLAEAQLLIPYGKEGVIGEVRAQTHILHEAYEADGLHLKVKASPRILAQLQKRISTPKGASAKKKPERNS